MCLVFLGRKGDILRRKPGNRGRRRVGSTTEGDAPCARNTLITAAALAALATPALAADFSVAQDTSTKRCQIAEQRPTASTLTIVGGGKVFTSRTEPESALKTIEVCHSGTTGSVPGRSTATTTTIAPR